MPLPNFGIRAVVVTAIGAVAMDVSQYQTHKFPSRITEHPVEDGSVIADHVTLLPTVLEIDGRVSDASVALSDTISGKGTAQDAFRELVRLQRDREPFTVVTGLAVYQNMLIETLEVPRDSSDGQSIRFSMVIRELQIVGRTRVANRDVVADDVRHTALSPNLIGLVAKVAA
jgi:hypothetical protein